MDERHRLIVTNIVINEHTFNAGALYEGDRLLEVYLEPEASLEGGSLLGNIYVGRVKNIVESLNAAFVEIAPGVPCYLSLADVKSPVYVKKINSPRLVAGDQLLVQVEQEAIKTKPPRLTTNLTFPGQYLALSTQEEAVGASRKLPDQQREALKEFLKDQRRTAFGVIVRTACKDASHKAVAEELWQLEQEAAALIAKAPYRTCFSCLRCQEPLYLRLLRQLPKGAVDEVVTDRQEVYGPLTKTFPELELRLYEDHLLPLSRCYRLEHLIQEALKPRVWLKSGGFLVIEPTEALTVIDVNSGKSSRKGDPQDHYRKVNLEAAEEIARQLRLRNISGIILVDFIDLKAREDQEMLLQRMKELVQTDPVKVQVVDYTRLNLMELTRKKVRRSLREQVKAVDK